MASVARQHRMSDWMDGEERLVPVIADGGEQAWVVLICFPTDPRVGDTFSFRGLQWAIVRRQDSMRGFVAHPRPTRGRHSCTRFRRPLRPSTRG